MGTGETIGKVIAGVIMAALAAVLILWFAPIPGGRAFLASPGGLALVAIGVVPLVVGVLGLGVSMVVISIESDGFWRTLGLVFGLVIAGALLVVLSRVLAPQGWVIVTFEVIGYACLAAGAVLVACTPFGIVAALWRRYH